jgi:hypothetical protein
MNKTGSAMHFRGARLALVATEREFNFSPTVQQPDRPPGERSADDGERSRRDAVAYPIGAFRRIWRGNEVAVVPICEADPLGGYEPNKGRKDGGHHEAGNYRHITSPEIPVTLYIKYRDMLSITRRVVSENHGNA